MSGVDAAGRLAACGAVTIEDGLSDHEFADVASTFGVDFADDHRAFLATGVPVGPGWPNWRAGGRALSAQLRLPVDGILFAVEWKQFWDERWGVRPVRMKHALRSAAYQLARVPQMVPVYANGYLPAGDPPGQPVLSIYQVDIRIAGADLLEYIDRQFGSDQPSAPPATTATVDFWSAHVR